MYFLIYQITVFHVIFVTFNLYMLMYNEKHFKYTTWYTTWYVLTNVNTHVTTILIKIYIPFLPNIP